VTAVTPVWCTGYRERAPGPPRCAHAFRVDLPTLGPGLLLRPGLPAAGVTDDEVRRLRRRGELIAVDRGAYLDPTDPRLRRPEERHVLQMAAALPRLAKDAVVSHQSAAVLHGLPVWNVPLSRVHVTRAKRSGALRTGRLHVHTAPSMRTRSSWSARWR
jgi:hypothetical protein